MSQNFYRPLGLSGLIVSATGLGCNNLGRVGTTTENLEAAKALIDAAIDQGVTFFDVADVYGGYAGQSEEFLGEALKGKRDQVIIGTKFGMNLNGLYGEDWGARGSRRYIRKAIDASLQRLQTDYIDLYQYHEPDNITPIEETLDALSDLVREGKVRYIGNSNFPGWLIAKADAVSATSGLQRFISAQNQYSLLARNIEHEVVPSAEDHGLSIIPYFPLFNGLLTGKYSKVSSPDDSRLVKLKPKVLANANWEQLDAFSAFAAERGVTELQVAFAWLLAQPAVDTVIAGATKPEQIRQNAEAAVAWQPSAADLDALDDIFPPVLRAGGFR